MSEAVLIAIRPEYCKLIASGEKTIEVRKTRPKRETPFKCYIYCTRGGKMKKNCTNCKRGEKKDRGTFCTRYAVTLLDDQLSPCKYFIPREFSHHDLLLSMSVEQLAGFQAMKACGCPPEPWAEREKCIAETREGKHPGRDMERCFWCWLKWLETKKEETGDS